MTQKEKAVSQLKDVFSRWEGLLATLSEPQISAGLLSDGQSIKDNIAHLRAWQALSIERVECALRGSVPTYAGWPKGIDPDAEENRDRINAWIRENHHDWPWAYVRRQWLAGFHRFIDLAQKIPETDLDDKRKYPWLGGYSLLDVLTGSYEHHLVDHLEPAVAWLRKHLHGLGGS